MVRIPNPMKNKVVADGNELKNSYPDAYVAFDEPGLHTINEWKVAVNPFDKAESDLSDAASCDIRPELSANSIISSVKRQAAFAFMLLALAVLAVHWQLTSRRR